MGYDRLIFRQHAIERMAARDIEPDEVRAVITHGEVIANYADDTPYPSRLMLGWIKDRPLHVVAADNDDDGETIIITAYVPDPTLWDEDFRSKQS
jgi:hypothetical protein